MLNPVALLLSFVMPACGRQGADGVPPPVPDLRRIERPASRNTALAAPAGFTPKPDIETRTFPVPSAVLLSAISCVAKEQKRVFVLAQAPTRVDWVVRSLIANLPDEVSAQVVPAEGGSGLILYSRSLHGRSDFGMNLRRVRTWLAALDALLKGGG